MSAANISVQSERIGLKQTTFAAAASDCKGKVTRRERLHTLDRTFEYKFNCLEVSALNVSLTLAEVFREVI
jgi:hypothetical protein